MLCWGCLRYIYFWYRVREPLISQDYKLHLNWHRLEREAKIKNGSYGYLNSSQVTVNNRQWSSDLMVPRRSSFHTWGPEIGPICSCESAVSPPLNGPWMLLKWRFRTRIYVDRSIHLYIYIICVVHFQRVSGAWVEYEGGGDVNNRWAFDRQFIKLVRVNGLRHDFIYHLLYFLFQGNKPYIRRR